MGEEMERLSLDFGGPKPTHRMSHSTSPANLVELTAAPTATHPISQIFSLNCYKSLIYKEKVVGIVVKGIGSS